MINFFVILINLIIFINIIVNKHVHYDEYLPIFNVLTFKIKQKGSSIFYFDIQNFLPMTYRWPVYYILIYYRCTAGKIKFIFRFFSFVRRKNFSNMITSV